MTAASEIVIDGRRQRAERSRAQVVRALFELISEGMLEPTVVDVSERARVSRRLVFKQFQSLDNLYAALIELQAEVVRSTYRPVDAKTPYTRRLRQFCEARATLWETIAPMRRAALRRAHASSVIRDSLASTHALARADAERTFRAELMALPRGERRRCAAALSACASWSYWNALRTEQGLDGATARRVLQMAIDRLLG